MRSVATVLGALTLSFPMAAPVQAQLQPQPEAPAVVAEPAAARPAALGVPTARTAPPGRDGRASAPDNCR